VGHRKHQHFAILSPDIPETRQSLNYFGGRFVKLVYACCNLLVKAYNRRNTTSTCTTHTHICRLAFDSLLIAVPEKQLEFNHDTEW